MLDMWKGSAMNGMYIIDVDSADSLARLSHTVLFIMFTYRTG